MRRGDGETGKRSSTQRGVVGIVVAIMVTTGTSVVRAVLRPCPSRRSQPTVSGGGGDKPL
jgi:hypothetical protein